jgi:hypothetical protein
MDGATWNQSSAIPSAREAEESRSKMAYSEIGEKIESLWQLTGQESGIVIYAGEGIICNWSPNDGLPRIGPFGGLLDWPMDPDTMLAAEEALTEEELSALVSDLDIIYDENGDAPQCIAKEFSARKYTLSDGTIVIAPNDWN